MRGILLVIALVLAIAVLSHGKSAKLVKLTDDNMDQKLSAGEWLILLYVLLLTHFIFFLMLRKQ